ncbi:CLUMA_CG019497, isoform A [Clunio marinus]|uniref:Putative sodium-coupled neutral amino acid transporter 11 n=1 Tax=Clunio marinus TaxID=568069 RepID=A0A1J1J4W6_9DIPT|nr:CLUMA_CG019497, isoform A [Clunio marinus]
MDDKKNGSNSIKYNTMERQNSNDSVEINAFDDISTKSLVKNKEISSDDSLSSLSHTSFNYINSIVGSGVIGIPYALVRAGYGVGLLLLIFVAIITDYSLRLMIKTAHLSGRLSYASVMESAFGSGGYYLLSFLQFLYPFLAMISYNVVVGDTLSKVLVRFAPSLGTSMGAVRFFIVFLVTLFVTTPLCLYKNVSRLAKISFISLVSVLLILLAVIYKLFNGDYANVPRPDDAYTFVQPDILSATGIMAFAFMCHHNTFLIYHSMKDSTLEKWEKVTHISVGFAWIVAVLFGIAGYATFTTLSQGDLLENYCYDDMNLARVLFCVSILLTFPLECFVSREIIKTQIKRFYSHELVEYDKNADPRSREDSEDKDLIVTLFVVFSAFFISPTSECLGPILELNGLLAAIPLSYILPGLIFLKLDPHSLFSREKLPAIVLVIFGLIVSISGSTGIVLGYCRDDEIAINATTTTPTATRLPLPKFRN